LWQKYEKIKCCPENEIKFSFYRQLLNAAIWKFPIKKDACEKNVVLYVVKKYVCLEIRPYCTYVLSFAFVQTWESFSLARRRFFEQARHPRRKIEAVAKHSQVP